MTENVCSINFFVNLIKIKRISKAIIKTQAEIGSICLAPLSSLKYFAVWQPFILQSSWFFSIILIHLIKSLPKPQCSKAVIRKLWFKESKLFLKTIAIRYPCNCSKSQVSIMSAMNLPLLPENLPLKYAVWQESNKNERTFSILRLTFLI